MRAGLWREQVIDARQIAKWCLGVQLAALFVSSTLLASNWQIRKDYAIRYQGVTHAARGIFNFEGTLVNWGFLQDHFELINYALVPFLKFPLHFAFPLYLQDCFIVLGEWSAISLLSILLRRLGSLSEIQINTVVICAVLMQILNPWVYMMATDDVHFFSIGTMAASLSSLVAALNGNKRWAWIASLLALACGDTVAIYAVGMALTYFAITRRNARAISAVIVGSLAWVFLASKLGFSAGSNFGNHFREILGSRNEHASGLDVLVGGLTHPTRIFHQLASNWQSLWGYIGASGVVGLFSPVSIICWINLVITGMSHGHRIAATPWENPAPVLLLASCSCYVVAHISTRFVPFNRNARFRNCSLSILLVNSVVWFAIWIPYSWHAAFLTDGPTIALLNQISREVDSRSQVIVSQGLTGRFADHDLLYSTEFSSVPIKAKIIHIVLTPYQGLETKSTASETNLALRLTKLSFAKLRVHRAGVWWFTLNPPRTLKSLRLDYDSGLSPGWAMLSSIGHVKYSSAGVPLAMMSDGAKAGYITYGAVWGLKNGKWTASIDIQAKSSFYIEIGDFSRDLLFARNHFLPTPTRVKLTIPFSVSVPPWASQGWGPFSFRPAPPAAPANVEIRIFTEMGGASILHSIKVHRAPGPKID